MSSSSLPRDIGISEKKSAKSRPATDMGGTGEIAGVCDDVEAGLGVLAVGSIIGFGVVLALAGGDIGHRWDGIVA